MLIIITVFFFCGNIKWKYSPLKYSKQVPLLNIYKTASDLFFYVSCSYELLKYFQNCLASFGVGFTWSAVSIHLAGFKLCF